MQSLPHILAKGAVALKTCGSKPMHTMPRSLNFGAKISADDEESVMF